MGTTLQEQRDFYAAMFGDCCPQYACNYTKDDFDEAILDCYSMLQYSIDQNNKEEISYWRKLLQENKVQRRMLTA